MDVRRFGRHYRSPGYTLARVRENYESYYDIRYPGAERSAGRPLRTSPAYAWHAAHGASFGEKAGWERVNHYATPGDEALRPRGWAGRHWSPCVEPEHRAVREHAGVFDETSFAKIEIVGPDAAGFCARVFAGHVGRPPGAVVYTQALNERGGIEMDVTVSRLAADAFLVVTGTAFGSHDLGWLRRQARLTGADVRIADVTSAWACFGLWGPAARSLLAPLTPASLSTADFPYPSWRATTVADVPVRALRVTYVGELGWELYCPTEYGAALWEALVAHGRDAGRVPGDREPAAGEGVPGVGERHRSGDDARRGRPGLRRAAGWRVRGGRGVAGAGARRLRCLTLADPRAVALGGEPVRVGDAVVAQVTSGGYGYTVQKSIAYAYLPVEASRPAWRWRSTASGSRPRWRPRALYDPAGARIRGESHPGRVSDPRGESPSPGRRVADPGTARSAASRVSARGRGRPGRGGPASPRRCR